MFQARIAPTPSGYLHIGNVFSFIYTWLLTRRLNGTLRLRIDDLDGARTQRKYIDDIFHVLDWLDISYDIGPSGTDDFLRHHSQQKRMELYQGTIQEIINAKTDIFYCNCTRKEIKSISKDGHYSGRCYHQTIARPNSAIRIRTPEGKKITVQNMLGGAYQIDLYQDIRDCIIWRKDNLPSYQLASLVDDLLQKINLIVRGKDLLPSTALQLFLEEQLGSSGFSKSSFVHHELIMSNGVKLSKSHDANSILQQFKAPKHVYIYIGKLLGIPEEASESLPLLLEHFNPDFNDKFIDEKM